MMVSAQAELLAEAYVPASCFGVCGVVAILFYQCASLALAVLQMCYLAPGKKFWAKQGQRHAVVSKFYFVRKGPSTLDTTLCICPEICCAAFS